MSSFCFKVRSFWGKKIPRCCCCSCTFSRWFHFVSILFFRNEKITPDVVVVAHSRDGSVVEDVGKLAIPFFLDITSRPEWIYILFFYSNVIFLIYVSSVARILLPLQLSRLPPVEEEDSASNEEGNDPITSEVNHTSNFHQQDHELANAVEDDGYQSRGISAKVELAIHDMLDEVEFHVETVAMDLAELAQVHTEVLQQLASERSQRKEYVNRLSMLEKEIAEKSRAEESRRMSMVSYLVGENYPHFFWGTRKMGIFFIRERIYAEDWFVFICIYCIGVTGGDM